jgi:hypothetical protein
MYLNGCVNAEEHTQSSYDDVHSRNVAKRRQYCARAAICSSAIPFRSNPAMDWTRMPVAHDNMRLARPKWVPDVYHAQSPMEWPQ